MYRKKKRLFPFTAVQLIHLLFSFPRSLFRTSLSTSFSPKISGRLFSIDRQYTTDPGARYRTPSGTFQPRLEPSCNQKQQTLTSQLYNITDKRKRKQTITQMMRSFLEPLLLLVLLFSVLVPSLLLLFYFVFLTVLVFTLIFHALVILLVYRTSLLFEASNNK